MLMLVAPAQPTSVSYATTTDPGTTSSCHTCCKCTQINYCLQCDGRSDLQVAQAWVKGVAERLYVVQRCSQDEASDWNIWRWLLSLSAVFLPTGLSLVLKIPGMKRRGGRERLSTGRGGLPTMAVRKQQMHR
jgi:hypothetical protein